jgi:hypothetical protein
MYNAGIGENLPPGRLSVWNPLDHIRLLYWIFIMPQHFKYYARFYGKEDIYSVGKWLSSTLIWLLPAIPMIAALTISNLWWILVLGVGWIVVGWRWGQRSEIELLVAMEGGLIGVLATASLFLPLFFGLEELYVKGTIIDDLLVLVVYAVALVVVSIVASITSDNESIGIDIDVFTALFSLALFGGLSLTPEMDGSMGLIPFAVMFVAVFAALLFQPWIKEGVDNGNPSWKSRVIGMLLVVSYVVLVLFFWFDVLNHINILQ